MEGLSWCLLAAIAGVAGGQFPWRAWTLKKWKTEPLLECWAGLVGPCESGAEEADGRGVACARTVFGDKDGAHPSFRARAFHLHQCGEVKIGKGYHGCAEEMNAKKSLFNDRKVFQRVFQFLHAHRELEMAEVMAQGLGGIVASMVQMRSRWKRPITYVCAPSEYQARNLKYPTSIASASNRYRDQVYATTTCICTKGDRCNQEPLPGNSFKWLDSYSGLFLELGVDEAINNISKEIQPMDFTPEASYEFPNSSELRSSEGVCPFHISLDILNCHNGKRNADFLVAAFKRALGEAGEECLEAPWCWRLKGEIQTNLSGVVYHLALDLAACPRLLNASHPWTFLRPRDVQTQVSTPCNRLQPGEDKTLTIHHGVPLRLGVLEFEPGELRLTCFNPQESSQADVLNELKHNLWMAVIVGLLQVTLCGLLLLGAVIRMEEPGKFLSFYLKLMKGKLDPFYRLFAVPDHLLEAYLEVHNLMDAVVEFQAVRDLITDHQRLTTYNFFGWRTDLDYRVFPCLGKPPEEPIEESKCTCFECKHLPRINLTKFISPARLIAMGLRERAMVDRADPLYDTFVALKTEEQLPLDEAPLRTPSSNLVDAQPDLTSPTQSDIEEGRTMIRRTTFCSKFSPNMLR